MSLSTENVKNSEHNKPSGFQEDFEHLRQVSLFNGFEYECLKLLAMLCQRVEFTPGDQLMVQGEDDGYAFLLLSGTVSAVTGKEDTIQPFRQYKAGKLIGCCGLLGKMPRLFTLEAVEKTRALRLSRKQFQKTLLQFPADMFRVTGNLAAELTAWDQSLLAGKKNTKVSECLNLGVSLI